MDPLPSIADLLPVLRDLGIDLPEGTLRVGAFGGDGSLEHWRREHWRFFSRECARIGRQPGPDMPVVCTSFEVLHVVPLSPPCPD
jgi:hypothetical protein